jgi:hypothetical protein
MLKSANRIAPFHWILDLGPSSKVALKCSFPIRKASIPLYGSGLIFIFILIQKYKMKPTYIPSHLSHLRREKRAKKGQKKRWFLDKCQLLGLESTGQKLGQGCDMSDYTDLGRAVMADTLD